MSARYAEPGDEIGEPEWLTCEDCIRELPEDEVRQCGCCGMTLCEGCTQENGVCCRAYEEEY